MRAPGGFDRPVVFARDCPDETVGKLAVPIPSPDGQRVAFQRLFGDAMTNLNRPDLERRPRARRAWLRRIGHAGLVARRALDRVA